MTQAEQGQIQLGCRMHGDRTVRRTALLNACAYPSLSSILSGLTIGRVPDNWESTTGTGLAQYNRHTLATNSNLRLLGMARLQA